MARSFNKSISVVMLLTICVFITADNSPVAEAAISCSQVLSKLTPCVSYVMGGGGPPPNACCSGIKTLNSAAQTTPDRQSVCNCLKSIAASFPSINYKLVQSLPANCGVNIPYKISPSTDCKSVK